MLFLITGLVLFLGIHTARVVAPQQRLAFIENRGDGAWKGLYSLISIIGFVLLIYGYSVAREDAAEIYTPASWVRGVQFLTMPIALILVIASQLPAGNIRKYIRHPMIIGVLIWAVGHLAGNGDLASILLFGSFFVWALVDTVSSFRRSIADGEVVSSVRYDLIAIMLGMAATWFFMTYWHEWLFGVAII